MTDTVRAFCIKPKGNIVCMVTQNSGFSLFFISLHSIFLIYGNLSLSFFFSPDSIISIFPFFPSLFLSLPPSLFGNFFYDTPSRFLPLILICGTMRSEHSAIYFSMLKTFKKYLCVKRAVGVKNRQKRKLQI